MLLLLAAPVTGWNSGTDVSSDVRACVRLGASVVGLASAAEASTSSPATAGVACAGIGSSLTEVRLTQANCWCKDDHTDQRMHCDYPNNSLIGPTSHPDAALDAVAAHIYFDEVAVAGGPTAFVPRASEADPSYTLAALLRMPGVAGHPPIADRTEAERFVHSAPRHCFHPPHAGCVLQCHRVCSIAI